MKRKMDVADNHRNLWVFICLYGAFLVVNVEANFEDIKVTSLSMLPVSGQNLFGREIPSNFMFVSPSRYGAKNPSAPSGKIIQKTSLPVENKVKVAGAGGAQKPGFCPSVILMTSKKCPDLCGDDNDCVGMKKCCRNGCGKRCTEPDARTGMHPQITKNKPQLFPGVPASEFYGASHLPVSLSPRGTGISQTTAAPHSGGMNNHQFGAPLNNYNQYPGAQNGASSNYTAGSNTVTSSNSGLIAGPYSKTFQPNEPYNPSNLNQSQGYNPPNQNQGYNPPNQNQAYNPSNQNQAYDPTNQNPPNQNQGYNPSNQNLAYDPTNQNPPNQNQGYNPSNQNLAYNPTNQNPSNQNQAYNPPTQNNQQPSGGQYDPSVYQPQPPNPPSGPNPAYPSSWQSTGNSQNRQYNSPAGTGQSNYPQPQNGGPSGHSQNNGMPQPYSGPTQTEVSGNHYPASRTYDPSYQQPIHQSNHSSVPNQHRPYPSDPTNVQQGNNANSHSSAYPQPGPNPNPAPSPQHPEPQGYNPGAPAYSPQGYPPNGPMHNSQGSHGNIYDPQRSYSNNPAYNAQEPNPVSPVYNPEGYNGNYPAYNPQGPHSNSQGYNPQGSNPVYDTQGYSSNIAPNNHQGVHPNHSVQGPAYPPQEPSGYNGPAHGPSRNVNAPSNTSSPNGPSVVDPYQNGPENPYQQSSYPQHASGSNNGANGWNPQRSGSNSRVSSWNTQSNTPNSRAGEPDNVHQQNQYNRHQQTPEQTTTYPQSVNRDIQHQNQGYDQRTHSQNILQIRPYSSDQANGVVEILPYQRDKNLNSQKVDAHGPPPAEYNYQGSENAMISPIVGPESPVINAGGPEESNNINGGVATNGKESAVKLKPSVYGSFKIIPYDMRKYGKSRDLIQSHGPQPPQIRKPEVRRPEPQPQSTAIQPKSFGEVNSRSGGYDVRPAIQPSTTAQHPEVHTRRPEFFSNVETELPVEGKQIHRQGPQVVSPRTTAGLAPRLSYPGPRQLPTRGPEIPVHRAPVVGPSRPEIKTPANSPMDGKNNMFSAYPNEINNKVDLSQNGIQRSWNGQEPQRSPNPQPSGHSRSYYEVQPKPVEKPRSSTVTSSPAFVNIGQTHMEPTARDIPTEAQGQTVTGPTLPVRDPGANQKGEIIANQNSGPSPNVKSSAVKTSNPHQGPHSDVHSVNSITYKDTRSGKNFYDPMSGSAVSHEMNHYNQFDTGFFRPRSSNTFSLMGGEAATPNTPPPHPYNAANLGIIDYGHPRTSAFEAQPVRRERARLAAPDTGLGSGLSISKIYHDVGHSHAIMEPPNPHVFSSEFKDAPVRPTYRPPVDSLGQVYIDIASFGRNPMKAPPNPLSLSSGLRGHIPDVPTTMPPAERSTPKETPISYIEKKTTDAVNPSALLENPMTSQPEKPKKIIPAGMALTESDMKSAQFTSGSEASNKSSSAPRLGISSTLIGAPSSDVAPEKKVFNRAAFNLFKGYQPQYKVPVKEIRNPSARGTPVFSARAGKTIKNP